ncbi:MAG: sensor histidine kinase [Humibacillus sp.]|nr:sensor histidine kinase [Humibacillus sp.]MDN5778641.1 sensor histidine kinase [Humibacillus sp.]
MTISERREFGAALAMTVLVAATMVVVAAATAATVRAGILGSSWSLLTSTSVIALVGALLAGRRPRHPVGWLLLATGVPFLVGQAAEGVARLGLTRTPGGLGTEAALWVANWVYPPALVPLFVLVALTFPDGHLPSRRWQGLAVLATALAVVLAVFGAVGQPTLVLGETTVPNPYAVAALTAVGPAMVAWAGLVLVGCSLAATLSLVLRWRGATRQAQRQIMWVVLALVVLAAAFGVDAAVAFLAPSVYPVVFPIVQLAPVVVPLAIAVAVMKHQLFDIEALVSRALLYVMLTFLLVGGYALAATWAGAVLPGSAGALARVLATAVVAVAFAPLRDGLQRFIGRRLYGDRASPYAAMTRLARQLQQPSAPEQVLATLVTSAAGALRSPYAAIELGDQPAPVVEHGIRPAAGGHLASVELTHAGLSLGRLVVAGRGRVALAPVDLRLLADLALPIGAAVHAVGLSVDLHRSRERMVLTMEEERRRVGRDLHDDLGPRLAAISMQVELARDLTLSDPARAHALLGDLLDQTEIAVQETRRVAHAHRPPALDSLGLVPALESHVAHVAAVPVRFEVPLALPALPAAVEVAAYRIALEAIQNVANHAQAQSCVLHLAHDEHGLTLEVADDGRGIPSIHPIGLGLQSMTERAAELGGALTVQPRPHGPGTMVRAVLPCRARQAPDPAGAGTDPGVAERGRRTR